MAGVAAIAGGLLASFATSSGRQFRAVDRVDALLPQTQCGVCGYSGCRPYAAAVVKDDAPINRCAPGGQYTVDEIADLLGHDRVPLEALNPPGSVAQVVRIDEDVCIGCTKCLQACPVDAIVGAAQQMHTVLEAHCTGCELCIPPCPVDCIEVIPPALDFERWKWPKPDEASVRI